MDYKEVILLGSGRWTPVRVAVANAIYHSKMHPEITFRLFTDYTELAEPLSKLNIKVDPIPYFKEYKMKDLGAGTIYEGKCHFFAGKIKIIREACNRLDDGVSILFDTDIVAFLSFINLFNILKNNQCLGMCKDRFDTLFMTRNKPKKPLASNEEWEYLERECDLNKSIVYNIGMLLFRRNKVTVHICDEWFKEWKKFKGGDQQSMSYLAFKRPVIRSAILTLDHKYNFFLDWWAMREGTNDVSRVDKYTKDGSLVIGHGHNICVMQFKTTDAWDEAERIMKSVGLKHGIGKC